LTRYPSKALLAELDETSKGYARDMAGGIGDGLALTCLPAEVLGFVNGRAVLWVPSHLRYVSLKGVA
jgi:hypothetical protein